MNQNKEKEPTRVFHLITRLLNGGAEGETIKTIVNLNQYDITLGYGASYLPEQVNRVEENGISTKRFPLLRHYGLFTSVPAVLSIAKFLVVNDFDIIHTHSTEAGIIGRAAASLAGVPIIIHTVHGVPFSEDRNRLLNSFVETCERSMARCTDMIITNADVIAQEYLSRDIGEKQKYQTVHSGIDIEKFANATPARGLPGKGKRILMVSRLAKGKGFSVLFDAIEEIDCTDFSLCIAGNGPLQRQLSAEIKERELEDQVFLLGYRDDISNIMASSDIFVLPSFREGTPRVITEAMAVGLPIISTKIAGIPEQVSQGENGYLVQPGDSKALKNRLEELLLDPDRCHMMGKESRRRADHFSASEMCEDVKNIYSRLLQESTNSLS